MPAKQNQRSNTSRRSSDIVKRDLRKRLRGKPTHSSTLLSIPRTVGLAFQRVISLVIIILLIAGFTLAGLGSGMLVGYITTAGSLSMEDVKNRNETTVVLDADGTVVAKLTGEQNINSQNVSFVSVKGTYIDEAFIAIEDERFLEHPGIDARRIGSAVLSALMNGGSATHGGSTITQQTVRLMTGEDQRSAQRKVQEWYKAIQLEQEKTKDQIMELYINLVPMGNSYVGIQAAADAYFDKAAKDLDLAECAFLAGIPNAPSIYNPLTETGLRNALRRMRIVLSLMYEQGKISKSQYNAALNEELVFRQTAQEVTSNDIYSYFVEYVINDVISDLEDKRGYSEKMARYTLYNDGLTIQTTLDSSVQASIEATFNDQSLFVKNPEAIAELPETPQGSIVVISNSPNPGQIKGMVGGFGEKTGNRILNRAVETHRQPGSSIKPLAVYGPALDVGKITTATIFADQEQHLDPENPTAVYPKNAEGLGSDAYEGNITVRRALTLSKNTVAAQIWMLLGGETSLNYLSQVGLPRDNENYLSIALGGFYYGMTTLEMAGAYGTFANGGIYTEPYAYIQVTNADGEVLLENANPVRNEVFKPETAYIMTSMMHDVVTSGTASALGGGIPGMYTAGKTGTSDKSRDKWFCGFTPYYTAAVWYGYDNRLGTTNVSKYDMRNAILIWQDAMLRIHEGLEPITSFEMPVGVLKMSICKTSGMLAGDYCPADQVVSDLFVPGAAMNPKEECTAHVAPAPTEALPTDPGVIPPLPAWP